MRSEGRIKRRLYRKPSRDIKNINLHALKDENAANILIGSQAYNLHWRRCYPKEFQLINAQPVNNFLSTDSKSDSDDLIHLKTGFESVKFDYNPIANKETQTLSEVNENQSECPLQNLF